MTTKHLIRLNALNNAFLRTLAGDDKDIVKELVQIVYTERNQTMAANIQEKFDKKLCKKGVMITGISHISVHGAQTDFPYFTKKINSLPGELKKLNTSVSSYLTLGIHCINMNAQVTCYNTSTDESLCDDAAPEQKMQCRSKLKFRNQFLLGEVSNPQDPSVKGAFFSPLKF